MRTNVQIHMLILSAVLITALALPGPASAQQDGFSESFDSPAPTGWELPREGAAVAEGVLQISPGGYALHFGDWSEISLTLQVNFAAESEALIGYYFREQGRYLLTLTTGSLRLEKQQDGSSTPLGRAGVASLQPDAWHTVKLTVASGQHQVTVDDELLLEATDPDPLQTGAIMLSAHGAGVVQVDDLELRGKPGGERPPVQEEPAQDGQVPPAAEGIPPAATGIPATSQEKGAGSLIEEFFASQASTITLTTFLINLLLAAVCAYVLSVVYTHWGASLSNRRKFAANFLLMTVTTTFIIMVVRSSVALSLGLVGALSIVRFRAAVKEPEELAYLFFALGIGIGLGDNQRLITLVAMAAGITLLGLRYLLRKPNADVNMHISIASRAPGDVPLEQLTETLGRICTRLKLVRFDETASAMEAAYLVELRRIEQLSEIRSALKALSPSLEITFMDNKGLW